MTMPPIRLQRNVGAYNKVRTWNIPSRTVLCSITARNAIRVHVSRPVIPSIPPSDSWL